MKNMKEYKNNLGGVTMDKYFKTLYVKIGNQKYGFELDLYGLGLPKLILETVTEFNITLQDLHDNLYFTYSDYDVNIMDLEFGICDLGFTLKNVKVDDPTDEFYWDDINNLEKAIKNASEHDFEVDNTNMF